MIELVKISGIKLSGELVQIDLQEELLPDEKLAALLATITAAKISIPHLHQGKSGSSMQSVLCIAAKDYPLLLTKASSKLDDSVVNILPSVGTITIFPRGSGLDFPTMLLTVLTQNNIPVYGMSSSVSAVVIHTDNSLLDQAINVLLTICELPENHSPFRPVIVLGNEVLETVAVYWEVKIRIYGMDRQTGFTLFRLSCPSEEATLLTSLFATIKDGIKNFNMFRSTPQHGEMLHCTILAESGTAEGMKKLITDASVISPVLSVDTTDKTGLITFYGPHFLDRFGIADVAFSCLKKNNLNLLASNCTGTSVHLILSENDLESAMECLGEKFIIPQAN